MRSTTRPHPVPVRVLVALGLALTLLAGCSADPATDATGSTTTMAERPSDVTFDDGVLTVGDVSLVGLAGYKESRVRGAPNWPVTSVRTIEAVVDRPAHPVVSAAVLDLSKLRGADVESLLALPEKALYRDDDLPALTDETARSGPRDCRYRIKHGVIDVDDVTRATGSIVVSDDGQPYLALLVDGFHPDDVRTLTLDIVGQLCPGTPAGA